MITQCAAVYLTEKTDVAFRPFGLDLFDKLVQACKAVRAKLEAEQRLLASDTLAEVRAQIPEGTSTAKLLANINSLTKEETVQAHARLSPEEDARLALLEKSLLDLQANNPEKLVQQLTLRTGRVQALFRHLQEVGVALSEEAVNAVFAVRTEGRRKSEEARRLRDVTFTENLLNGTGLETWSELWEIARRFSQEEAYPGLEFPVVENDVKCVLCQQTLDTVAGQRLKQFEAFVASTTERELKQARETFIRLRKNFKELRTTTEAIDETLKEIRIEHEAVADTIANAIASNEKRRKAIVLALTEDKDLAPDCPALVPVKKEVTELLEQLNGRIKTLGTNATEEKREEMAKEAQELRSRKLLAQYEETVLAAIERKKKYAAYSLCIEETKTKAITQKSTAVTKITVSKRLKESFQDELKSLAFRHAEVELKDAGGADGVLYHKLILTRAPGVELPRVVSEGEQRCLSIAAFFAELSTADDPSGIVFDDPVSSLDYRWREGVARRLVQEARKRQVIVFTHDVVFLLLLKQFAEELGVEQLDQHVRHLSIGAGVCTEELPWVALTIKKKIGYLKKGWQAADKLFRDGHQDAYEKEAQILYGLLREAWERALEEVLLGGIVERFRPGVQTQQVCKIADISDEDCVVLENAMTKCSKWLCGHDQAAAARAPVPEPVELQEDIQELEQWVSTIRKRR